MDLLEYQVKNVPPSIYYISNFITRDEESHIIKNVYSAPKPKWTFLSNRRLQDYGGIPHEKGMIPEKIPSWLQVYMNKIDELNLFEGKKVNQVLINEYLPGQGIMPHTDGPIFSPIITTITCGSHTILEFWENSECRTKVCDLLLERCSLVIIKNDMYSKYLHSISEVATDVISSTYANLCNCGIKYFINDALKRETRVSVTIRNVPKILKIKLS
ncbi:alpha-ketoglutarate-dependent dioxygenase alkB homolog 6 [Anoplophora glabripennis]|uniref:alpha-ketoglutarate-dependent dioxygenase alkB homolog 6 n=1 Tax=Anoplophora glabripennis TaxID=217634 RepID=UPI000874827D|nr:alpha-ketoglutarate-dependent dioxygenase alkB homolog 6 [Anoplophora glabripennis]